MKLILAALLVGLAWGQEEVTTEASLVRCRRPLCAKFCEFGNQLDSSGCPICQCLEDPCLEARCAKGQMCVRMENCAGHPCTNLPFTCENYPCPQVMCSEFCEFGLQTNEYGCDTCTCMKNPCNDVECNVDEECKVIEDPNCPTGGYCNKVGKCTAAAPLRAPEEPMLPKCPLTRCTKICRFGFKKNEKDCEICECKSSPCEDVKCGEGEKCTHEGLENCQHDICENLKTTCSVQPICEHKLQQHKRMMNNMGASGGPKMIEGMQGMHGEMKGHPLECDDKGSFRPRQCHPMTGECWCVNDLGEELEGSRSADKKEVDCAYNKTQTVRGHLELSHNMTKDLDQHAENLRPILVARLGEWMMIEEKYIQEVEITPCGKTIKTLKVDFVIRGEIEDDIDLASSVHHLQLKVTSETTIIHYQSFMLIPMPESLETHHEFKAEPIAHAVDKEHSFLEYYRVHKTTIVILIGLVLLASILVVMLVQVVKRRKVLKLQRRENYQQNLAFTNEVYGKLAFLDDLAKDKTPDAEKNETIA